MKSRWLSSSVLLLVLLSCTSDPVDPSAKERTNANAGGGGSSGGGSNGGQGGAGNLGGTNSGGLGGFGAGAGGVVPAQCAEIHTKEFTNPNEWAWSDGNFIKIISGMSTGDGSDCPIFIREFDTNGNVFTNQIRKVKPDDVPLTCAWKEDRFFCTWDERAFWGSTKDPVDHDQLNFFPETLFALATHWDGEAFAVHLASNEFGDGTLELIRVNTDGEVVQERTHVGSHVYDALSSTRPRIVTDPGSGRTFVVAGSGYEFLQVSAHERDGTPLFPMGTLFNTLPNITNRYPAVGHYGDGVLVVTRGDSTAKDWWPKPHFYNLSATGELTHLPDVPLPDGESVDSGILMAMVAHGPDDAWMVLSTYKNDGSARLVVVDWKDGAFGTVRAVMDSHDVVNPEKPYYFRFDDPIAFEVAGQRWVGVYDLSVPGKGVHRLLRVDDPSCRYKPIPP